MRHKESSSRLESGDEVSSGMGPRAGGVCRLHETIEKQGMVTIQEDGAGRKRGFKEQLQGARQGQDPGGGCGPKENFHGSKAGLQSRSTMLLALSVVGAVCCVTLKRILLNRLSARRITSS